MEFLVDPLKAAGVVRFGMIPNEVRAAIRKPFRSFKRSEAAEHPCDYFEKEGVFVYYDASGVAEAAEFATPSVVLYGDQDLLQLAHDRLTPPCAKSRT